MLRDLERAKIMGGMEKVTSLATSDYGTRYSVDGVIETPDGRNPRVRTPPPRRMRGDEAQRPYPSERLGQMVLRRRARGPDSIEHGREHREVT